MTLLRKGADFGHPAAAFRERLEARPEGDAAEQGLHGTADQHGAGTEAADAELTVQHHVAAEGCDADGGGLSKQLAALLPCGYGLRQGSAHLRGAALQTLVAALEQRLGTEDLHGVNAAQRVEQEVEAALLGQSEVMRGAAHAPARQGRQQTDATEKGQRHQNERTGEVPDANEVKQRERQVEHRLKSRSRPSLTQSADGGEALRVIAVSVGFQRRERSMKQALHGLTMRLRLGGRRHASQKPAAHVPQQRLQQNGQGNLMARTIRVPVALFGRMRS